MAVHTKLTWRFSLVLALAGIGGVALIPAPNLRLGSSVATAQEAPAEGDYEALAQGAVHEAFAEPVSYDPEPGDVIEKAPPEPIEELPPDEKPEGDNVEWIPGYWNWDEDRENFVWLSGFWRDIPPGREWVAGYWTKVDDGWQRIPGYWSSTEVDEVEYLPDPPSTLESGPTSPAPTTEHVWVPGCWMWRDVRYAWRPGYWVVGRPNWVWVPAHYVWTPAGFVFVSGYWDFPVADRGLLFAPVYFSNPVYVRPAYRFTPAVVVNISLFTNHLWVRPRWGCYYFGDYYATRYANRGFYPWHQFHARHHGYDPIFVQHYHQHVHVEKNRDWMNSLQRDYTRHVDNVDLRPKHTFAAIAGAGAVGAVGVAGAASMKNLGLVTSLKQASKTPDLPVKLQPIDDVKRQEFVKKSVEAQNLAKDRAKQEKIAGEGRPMPPRKGRPERGPNGEPLAKTPLPKIDAPNGKPGTGEAPKVDPTKVVLGKDAADQAVRKVTRTRSSLAAKTDAAAGTGAAGKTGAPGKPKREVPPLIEKPVDLSGVVSKPGAGKGDQPGRNPGTPTVIGKPTRKPGGRDDDDAPGKLPGVTTGKGKPRDMPNDNTPKPNPKIELPKGTPKIELPKGTPKIDLPQKPPKVDVPKVTPKNDPPKFDPPRTKPRQEQPKVKPAVETPRTTPKATPKVETPRNPPASKPRNNSGNEGTGKPKGKDKGKDKNR